MISESLWQRRFDSDPNIVGRSINLNDKSFTVVGVIARGIQAPLQSDEIELWAPVSHGFALNNRYGHYLNVFARLKPDVTTQQAQTDMNTIASRLQQQYPESNKELGVRVVSLGEQIVGNSRTSLLVMLGAVVFVLANRCGQRSEHVAGSRGSAAKRDGHSHRARRRPLANRAAVVDRKHAAVIDKRHLGLLVALWGIDLLVAMSPADLPRVKEVTIDLRVLGFTLAVSVLTGILFGLLPALQASRPNLNERLKAGGRSATSGIIRQRLRGFLVIAEIALSLMLLVGAGLLIRSFLRLQAVNPGFNSTNVLTMQLDLSGPKYKTGAQVIAFHNQLLERLKQLPGVQYASTRSFVPIASDASFAYLQFNMEGRRARRLGSTSSFLQRRQPRLFPDDDDPHAERTRVQRPGCERFAKCRHRQCDFGPALFRLKTQ